MVVLEQILGWLEGYASLELAEDWDNVGLLAGDPQDRVERLMACLTITDATADEAIEERCQLIVTHHPLPFRPLSRVTPDSTPGRLLLKLIRAGVAIYSPHTAFDSAATGINFQLAKGLGLYDIEPLRPSPAEDTPLGTGRMGQLAPAVALAEMAARTKQLLRVDRLQFVGEEDRPIRRVAVGCGSAGELLTTAIERGCDLMILGETRWHTCLEAAASGVSLLLPGHYASERFAVEQLAEELAAAFSSVHVWASRRESDPLGWL